jgi:hypothetical protein
MGAAVIIIVLEYQAAYACGSWIQFRGLTSLGNWYSRRNDVWFDSLSIHADASVALNVAEGDDVQLGLPKSWKAQLGGGCAVKYALRNAYASTQDMIRRDMIFAS